MPKQPPANTQQIKEQLYPFCEIRDPLDLRVGILTIREKWERLTGQVPEGGGNRTFTHQGKSFSVPPNLVPGLRWQEALSSDPARNPPGTRLLAFPWQLSQFADWAIREDFTLLTQNRLSQPVPPSVWVDHPENLFIEEGADLAHVIINTGTGPVYIGRGATVMEGTCIRGPFALGEGSVVKMGTRIYGATSAGPHCVLGGEIKNSVLLGYSNKAHDGYLGDSVLGEWCNLGAGTSNSNLKNTVEPVSVWNPRLKTIMEAGTKCGLLMGDYSRCAINTSFNTGAVVGISAHVFGTTLTPKFIPDFSWGGFDQTRYQFDKAIRDIGNWKQLKNKSLTEEEIQVLKHIFER